MNFQLFLSAAPSNVLLQRSLRALVRFAAAAMLLTTPAAFAIVTATPSVPVLQFPATPVGTTVTATVTFSITGYNSYPGLTFHYGLDYATGAETCDGATPTETCSMTVKFTPTLPGARKDAIFVTYSGSRLATVLLAGVGTAPMGALQSGVLSNSSGISTLGAGNYSAPVVDERHVVYFFYNNNLYRSSGLGTPTLLKANATSGDVYNLAIDGAGVLYWGVGTTGPTTGTTLNTYDTVQNTSGTLTLPASDVIFASAVDVAGNVFAIGTNNPSIYQVTRAGTSTTTAINPGVVGFTHAVTDAAGNLFFGSATINELTTGGTQTQVSANPTGFGLAIDSAATLYISNSGGNTVELAPQSYATAGYALLSGVVAAGSTVGSDGTVYIGMAGGIDVIDRTQNPLAFPNQTINTASTTQTINVLNIGNMPLTYSNIAISGTGFALQTAATSPCTPGITLAAGASCNLAVNFTGPYAGSFTGSVVLTSNSLNNAASTQTIPLTAFIHGPAFTASPASVTFPTQTIATTSSQLLVTITNNGYDATTGMTFSSSNPAFTLSTAPNTPCSTTTALPSAGNPFNSCQVAINFTPLLTQPYTGTITVTGVGGSYPNSAVTIAVSGNGAPTVTQTAGGANNTLAFNTATVGVAQASAQTITASFLISGETSLVTPTASMHYGTSFTAGTATCTGGIGAQTCTVPVTFTPQYPGARRDALFLTAGGVRIATALVSGVGTGPLALMQPGVITNPILNGAQYYYNSTVDENGTDYVLNELAANVTAITKAGVVTILPINGLYSPRAIGINGAGVLYIASQNAGPVVTYDTVQGIEGSIPYPTNPASGTIQQLAVGNLGNVYLDNNYGIYTVTPNGTTTYLAFNPAFNPAPSEIITDSSENLFMSGVRFYEIPAGASTYTAISCDPAVTTPCNQPGNSGFAIDAAGTLYSGRYGQGGVEEVTSALSYNSAVGTTDGTAGVLGAGIAPDGTVWAGNYQNVDKVDRSQGLLSFNSVNANQAATPQVATIYNGGNMPLTVTSLTLTGDPNYSITANNCTSGLVIQPGAVCSYTVNFTAPHNGVFTGSIAIVTNSLNTPTTQTVALTDTVTGAYLTVSPTTLSFGAVALNTPSAPQYITVTNSGANAADIQQASAGNGRFAITIPPACNNIAVGGSCQLSVIFTPTASGLLTSMGGLSVVTSLGGGNTPNATPQITFTGTGGPAAAPAVTFSPTSVSFTQPVNTTSPAAIVQLTNSGNASLTLTSLYNSGPNNSYFTLVTAPSSPCTSTTTLAAGASCNIAINFAPFQPTQAGPFTTSIYITDNAGTGQQTIAVTGSYTTTPQLQITPAQLNFFAGTGAASLNGTGNGAPALSATFDAPSSVAQDTSGNTYIVDQGANTVRKVDSSGNISTFAGLPGYGPGSFGGDNSPAVSANLSSPTSVAVDPSGNVYIADYGNLRVRKVVPSTGIITTYIGNGSGFYNGAAGPNTPIPSPNGICFDPSGNLYIASTNAALVLKVTPALAVSIFAGNFTGTPNGVNGYNGDNIAANTAEVNFPNNVASDQLGNIYIADTNNYRVRKVAVGTGIITTVAGNGASPGTTVTGDGSAAVNAPVSAGSIATDLAGDLYITSQSGVGYPNVVRQVVNGIISTVAGGGTGAVGAGAPSAQLGGLGYPAIGNNGSILIPSFSGATVGVLSAGPSGFLQFGSQAVNTTSTAQVVTLRSVGNTTLALAGSTYTATGPFTVTGGTCTTFSASLSPTNNCTLIVTFTPTAAGPATGTISVPSNASISPQTINLQGDGTAAAAPAVTYSPNALTFSAAVNTTSAIQMITVTNTGTATLNGPTASTTGANGFYFNVQSTTCTGTLAVNASCTLSINFSPSLTTTVTAGLSLVDNAGDSPQTVSLTGTGTAALTPIVSFSVPELDFPNTTVGLSSTPMIVMLTNKGTAALSITNVAFTGYGMGDFTQTNNCGTSLAINAACTFSVTFAPQSPRLSIAQISITDNAAASPQIVTVTGTGIAANAPTLTPQQTTFANTLINTTTNPQTLTFTNAGVTPLTGISVSLTAGNTADFAETTNCGITLAVGASCSISATFTPLSALTFNAVVSVASSYGTLTANLTGTGTAPQALLNPGALSFGSVTVGNHTAPQTLTLNNPGNAALTGGITVSVAGANPADFSQTNNCISVAVGGSCTINVTFAPLSAAAFGATISVVDSVGTQTATLTGTGTAVPAPVVTFGSAPIFPATTIGATSAAQNVTITNTGNATLNISNIGLTGTGAADFSETTNCASNLGANESCTISVVFAPASVATFMAAITVTDNATGGTQSLAFSGTGTPIPAAQAVLSPTTLTFPSTSIATTSAAQPITLSNPGTAPLTITNIILAGANTADFAQTNNCGASLAAGANCTISVTFTPVSATTFTATVSVADSVSGSPQTATLTGTGSAFTDFGVSAPANTQSVDPGGTAFYNINVTTLTGNFTTPVTLTATGLPTGATATFAPASVTPGLTAAPSVLTVQTSPSFARLSQSNLHNPAWAALLLFPLLGIRKLRRRISPRLLTLVLISLAALLPLSGCGGGYFGAAPATYTITVTGSSATSTGTVTHSTTVTLNLQ